MFMFVIYEDLRSYAYSVSSHAWLSIMTFDYKNWKKKKPFEINKNNDDMCISQ